MNRDEEACPLFGLGIPAAKPSVRERIDRIQITGALLSGQIRAN